MKIRIISFTKKGFELGCTIADRITSYDFELIFKGRDGNGAAPAEEPLTEICRSSFEMGIPLVFIGATGIAVRSIAPFVRDKLRDPAVLNIDELGRFVIPLLSGHVGGANELTIQIAEAIGAVPVITTATDINEAFPADVFARENNLTIVNRDGIAKTAAASLSGRPVTISIKDYPPEEPVDIAITDEQMPEGMASLRLSPKRYALGMGCRRGKSFEELRDFALTVLTENKISLSDVGCIATIDVKKDEEGLKALSQAWKLPLITFEASVLARASGDFSSSQRVLESVGVDNVCERAAVLAAGAGSALTVRKTANNGMTAAVAEVRSKQRSNK